jgi:hypothetical protein
MEYIKEYSAYFGDEKIVFKNKNNPNLIITITKSKDNRIESIDNPSNLRFPYNIGQLLNRGIETWACNNNFLINGKDTCPEKKIFGIKAKDIPQGHPFRYIYPVKFN